MVVAAPELEKIFAHEVEETEGLFRLHCHRCRKDIAHNLPDPSTNPRAKRDAMREHQKSCKATDFEFSATRQMKSRLE